MKTKNGMRLASALLAVLMAVCVLPASSLAALPSYLEIADKYGFESNSTAAPTTLVNGNVWVDRIAKSTGNSPIATIEISALGREFSVTEQVKRKYNIMFVLDMSNSMNNNGKVDTMVTSANAAVAQLAVGGNKVGLVTFGTEAAQKRALDTSKFELSAGYADGKINVKPSGGYDGGTNIQAGLNVAYKKLNDNLSDGAIPVIILLSDGAPTYYYLGIDSTPTSGEVKGYGDDTTNNEMSMTIAQASYLKAMMPGLSIYTIAFDITSNEAKATLNPTSTNIGNVSGLADKITEVKNSYVSSSTVRGKMVNNYADGAYTASNSTSSLNAVLANIINKIKISGPVAESQKSATNSELAESSYVRITDSIGEGFSLASAATIRLNGTDYAFTRSGSTFSYSGDNTQVRKIVLTYSGGKLVWKIPGSVLPCISSDGSTKPAPIKLTYAIELSGNDLVDKLYETSSNCEVWFTPAPDNPAYPAAIITNTPEADVYTMINAGASTYYRAVYLGSGGGTQLLRYGTKTTSSGDYNYVPNVSGMAANYNGTTLTVNEISGATRVFSTISSKSDSIAFRTKQDGNPENKADYNVRTSEIDGQDVDVTVTGVSKSGGKYNITAQFTVSGVVRTYTFADVPMSKSGKRYIGTATLPYSVTELVNTTAATKRYSYDGNTLTLDIPNKGVVTLRAGQVGNVTTTFETLNEAQDAYVVKVRTDNGDGTYVEVAYTLSNDVLSVATTTAKFSTNAKAEQTLYSSSAGAMLVTSNNIIDNVMLKPYLGSNPIIAKPITVNGARDYMAKVELTFTSVAKFSGLTFALQTVNGSTTTPLSGYTVTGTSSNLKYANGVFSADAAGSFSIIIELTNPYKPSVPASFLVQFNGMSYKTAMAAAKTLGHNDGYANQQVKVIMSSPAKH